MKRNQIRLLKFVISVMMCHYYQEFLFVKPFCDSCAVRLLLWVVLSVQRKLILCSWDYLLCRWTECLHNLQYFLHHPRNCTCVLKVMELFRCAEFKACIPNAGQTCYKQYLVNPWKLLSMWNAFFFIIRLKVFCSVSSSLLVLCFLKQFEAKGILLLQSRLLYLRETKADCLCKSHWFSCTWCLLLFFFFSLTNVTLINSVWQACLRRRLCIYHSFIYMIYFS